MSPRKFNRPGQGRKRSGNRRPDGRESISVTAETYEKIKTLAALRGESMSQFVEAVTGCLDVEKQP